MVLRYFRQKREKRTKKSLIILRLPLDFSFKMWYYIQALRPVGQVVKTPPSHGGFSSSNLLRVTSSKLSPPIIAFVAFSFSEEAAHAPTVMNWRHLLHRFCPNSRRLFFHSEVFGIKKAGLTLFLIKIIQRKAVLRVWTDSFGCPSFPFAWNPL